MGQLIIHKKITIITPVYNEEESIPLFYRAVTDIINPLPYDFDLLFVNDGSEDRSAICINALSLRDPRVHTIEFSRNFGKEAATTAGLHYAASDAAILIDVDMQHPVDRIPEFIKQWEDGAEIVVGVRAQSKSDSMIKRVGSRLFHRIMQSISETRLVPQETDYRLLDRKVIAAYRLFTEHDRITRGLIDWLGFNIALISFEANERARGIAKYSIFKLWKLARASLISHSLLPLRIAGYLGALSIVVSVPMGVVMFVDRYFYPLGFNFSGPAILADILLFLVGVILVCMGLLAFYIEHIFQETKNRPMYIVRDVR